MAEDGRPATPEALADAMGLSVARVEGLIELSQQQLVQAGDAGAGGGGNDGDSGGGGGALRLDGVSGEQLAASEQGVSQREREGGWSDRGQPPTCFLCPRRNWRRSQHQHPPSSCPLPQTHTLKTVSLVSTSGDDDAQQAEHEREHLAAALGPLVAGLEPRLAEALRLRLGLEDGGGGGGSGGGSGGMTTGEVAARLGVSRQRAEQLLKRAAAQLRARLEADAAAGAGAGAGEGAAALLDRL